MLPDTYYSLKAREDLHPVDQYQRMIRELEVRPNTLCSRLYIDVTLYCRKDEN